MHADRQTDRQTSRYFVTGTDRRSNDNDDDDDVG